MSGAGSVRIARTVSATDVAGERPAAREHLEQHAPEREDVAARVARLAARLLG